jgi:hypothetical protein
MKRNSRKEPTPHLRVQTQSRRVAANKTRVSFLCSAVTDSSSTAPVCRPWSLAARCGVARAVRFRQTQCRRRRCRRTVPRARTRARRTSKRNTASAGGGAEQRRAHHAHGGVRDGRGRARGKELQRSESDGKKRTIGQRASPAPGRTTCVVMTCGALPTGCLR